LSRKDKININYCFFHTIAPIFHFTTPQLFFIGVLLTHEYFWTGAQRHQQKNFQGGQWKKDQKIAKKIENSTIKPLSTKSVPCMKIHLLYLYHAPRCRCRCMGTVYLVNATAAKQYLQTAFYFINT